MCLMVFGVTAGTGTVLKWGSEMCLMVFGAKAGTGTVL